MKLKTRTSLLFLLIAVSVGSKTNLSSTRKNDCPETKEELKEEARILIEPLAKSFEALVKEKRVMSKYERTFLKTCAKLRRGVRSSQKKIQSSILKEFKVKIKKQIPIFEKAAKDLGSSKKYKPYKALVGKCDLKYAITDGLVEYIARKVRASVPARVLMQFFWNGYVSKYDEMDFSQAARQASQYLKSGRSFNKSDEYKKMTLGRDGAVCYKKSLTKLENYVEVLLKTGSLTKVLNNRDYDGWPVLILRNEDDVNSCLKEFFKHYYLFLWVPKFGTHKIFWPMAKIQVRDWGSTTSMKSWIPNP